MSDQRDGTGQLALSCGPTDPDEYSSPDAKARFDVAKYYGMGSDGEWSVEEIADALDVTPRQVYKYLDDSEIGRQTREMQATTEAEWRLDAALTLREEIEELEEIEKELLEQTTTVHPRTTTSLAERAYSIPDALPLGTIAGLVLRDVELLGNDFATL